MVQSEYKISTAIIRLLESNIVENHILDNATIDKEDVLEIKAKNEALTNEKPYAVLINSGSFTSITKEARELTASKKFANRTVAKAILINSLGNRIIGNFYLRINKPYIKTRLFSDKDEAIEWLRSQLE